MCEKQNLVKDFPRLGFLKKEEISQFTEQFNSETKSFTPHFLRVLFGIDNMIIKEGLITQISSSEGQSIDTNIKFENLKDIQTGIEASIAQKIKEGFEKFSKMTCLKDYPSFISELHGQAVYVVNQVVGTARIEAAIKNAELPSWICKDKKVDLKGELEEAQLTNDFITEYIKTNTDMSPIMENKVFNLNLELALRVKIIKKLIEAQVTSVDHELWVNFPKFYRTSDDLVEFSLGKSRTLYGNNFIGDDKRLITTPLTYEIYERIFCSINEGKGLSIEGPAGTGKTETLKDFSKCIGKHTVVFNSSDQFTADQMAEVLQLALSSNTWVIFDEFNRIKIEELKKISDFITSIRNAMQSKTNEVDINGVKVKICGDPGIFITFNPGYKGRTDLPKELYSFFNSKTAILPDFEIIAANMLMNIGFKNSICWGKTLMQILNKCKNTFNSRHLDFGMRRLLGFIKTCKMFLPYCEADGESNPVEKVTFIKSLRIMKISMNNEEVQSFYKIVKEVTQEDISKDLICTFTFEHAKEVAKKLEITANDDFLDTVAGFYCLIHVRHTCGIIGKIEGSDNALKILSQMFAEEYKTKCHITKINEKDNTGETYGVVDRSKFVDENMETALRKIQNCEEFHLITVNQPINPEWIENYNTLMDDNRVLCLESGERLPLPKNAKIVLIDSSSFKNACPAHVSRVGVVYLK